MAETVSCEVAGVFPAREITFHMALGDQELNAVLSWEGDTAWANATIRAMEPGDQELSCLVALGLMEQKARQPVHVYSKWAASLLPHVTAHTAAETPVHLCHIRSQVNRRLHLCHG